MAARVRDPGAARTSQILFKAESAPSTQLSSWLSSIWNIVGTSVGQASRPPASVARKLIGQQRMHLGSWNMAGEPCTGAGAVRTYDRRDAGSNGGADELLRVADAAKQILTHILLGGRLELQPAIPHVCLEHQPRKLTHRPVLLFEVVQDVRKVAAKFWYGSECGQLLLNGSMLCIVGDLRGLEEAEQLSHTLVARSPRHCAATLIRDGAPTNAAARLAELLERVKGGGHSRATAYGK